MKFKKTLLLATTVYLLSPSPVIAEQTIYNQPTNTLNVIVEKGDTLEMIANNLNHSKEWLEVQIKGQLPSSYSKLEEGLTFKIRQGYIPEKNITIDYSEKGDFFDNLAKDRGVMPDWLWEQNKDHIKSRYNPLTTGQKIITDWNLNPPLYVDK